MLYLTITQGASPVGARPIIAVQDQRLIAEFLATVARKGEECASEAADERPVVPRLRAVGRDEASAGARS